MSGRGGWLVLLLSVVACDAAGKAMQSMANPAGAEGQQAAAGPALGVADEQGLVLDQRAVAGKVVIVDFWASWCQPCQHSIPFYRRMHERFRTKGLLVVGVNTDDEKPKMADYLMSHPLPFSVVWDGQKALTGRFGVAQLPTTFLFDRRGRLRKTRSGFNPEEARSVEDEIRLLLGEDGG